MKSCLLIIGGIPEWDLQVVTPDGIPNETIEYRRLHQHQDKWILNFIRANPDVNIETVFSFDFSFQSPSEEIAKRMYKDLYGKTLIKKFRAKEDTLSYLRNARWSTFNIQSINNYTMENAECHWNFPEGFEAPNDGKVFSPNLMPYERMQSGFEIAKKMNKDYDYMIYIRPDAYIRKPLKLERFDNTISIFHPNDNNGGLIFTNKDFDYMWAGDFKVFKKFLDAWRGNPIIAKKDLITANSMTDDEKFELCKRHDLHGHQFRPTKQQAIYKLAEDYMYECVKYIEDQGHIFSTSSEHGIYCVKRRCQFKPGPFDNFYGEKQW